MKWKIVRRKPESLLVRWVDGWMGGWMDGWMGAAETFVDGYKRRDDCIEAIIFIDFLSYILDISPTPTTASPGVSSTAVQGQFLDWNCHLLLEILGDQP